MKIIYGLGNPGDAYARTRHNAGFICVDMLRAYHNLSPFTYQKKFQSDITSFITSPAQEKIMLVKPLTFMNRSGIAVHSVMSYFNCQVSDIIVIHDDLDIRIGTHKISHNVRAAGHNGIQDIIDTLGSQDFCRIRIGVEKSGGKKDREHLSGKDFVLQDLIDDELEMLRNTCHNIIVNDINALLS